MIDQLEVALVWYDHDFMPVPLTPDQSKSPAVPRWAQWQHSRPPRDVVERNFRMIDHDGLGLICGEASDGLEMMELEGRALEEGLLNQLMAKFQAIGEDALWEKISKGYVELSPGRGLHYLFRVTHGEARGNLKLARRPATEAELVEDPGDKIKTLIETRGQGGFTVIAPSAGRSHPSGLEWRVITGDPSTVPTINGAERDLIYAVARELDQMPEPTPIGHPARANGDHGGGELRPGEDFNARGNWADILLPHRWKVFKGTSGLLTYWERPGKIHRGVSASTGRNDQDRLYVFSTATVFEPERSYSKFGAYAVLNHHGDFKAAARDLRQKGFGSGDRVQLLPKLEWNSTASGDGAGPDQQHDQPAGENAGAKDDQHQPEGDQTTPDPMEKLINEALIKLMVQDEARRRFLARQPRPPLDADLLSGLLTREPPPTPRVQDLVPARASTVIVAPRKAGKTVFELNLIHSLITGEPFLGRFRVEKITGRVGLLNFEVDPYTLARWAAAVGVPEDRLFVVNLRDRANPLGHDGDMAALGQLLRAQEVEALMVDPFARAFPGDSENNTTEVTRFLTRLDEFTRTTVGAQDLFLIAHSGWSGGQERARGASSLEGWADSLINIVLGDEKDITSPRFLKAFGRDVEMAEEMISFDPATKRLTLPGNGSRRASAQDQKDRDRETGVLDVLGDNAGSNQGQLAGLCREAGVSLGQRGELKRTLTRLMDRGLVRDEPGPGHSRLYFRVDHG